LDHAETMHRVDQTSPSDTPIILKRAVKPVSQVRILPGAHYCWWETRGAVGAKVPDTAPRNRHQALLLASSPARGETIVAADQAPADRHRISDVRRDDRSGGAQVTAVEAAGGGGNHVFGRDQVVEVISRSAEEPD
ncbi:hypothetical protein OOZ19_02555, partial [Saccharopolyspora sp. NFXS83]|uniref:hypothetical protein n=1 Tax=Saccharopolyspora sp. NFXS83 TaxID=2993560 RepID=UPI00224B3B35